jgi:FkbM family methyltransferase
MLKDLRTKSLLQSARTTFERVSGVHVYRGLPHGTDPASDISRVFPQRTPRTVLDVGANVGQSAAKFRRWWPQAKIYCFEPVRETFATLSRAVAPLGDVECVNIGFGDESATLSMILTDKSLTSHVVRAGETAAPGTSEQVRIERLDAFCAERGIDTVGYLKIDAEGFDLKVLQGGGELLRRGAVDFIQVESGMNPGFPEHVPFVELFGWLTTAGYDLFGIYQQAQAWPSGQILKRADPVFVSRRLVTSR